MDVDVSGTSRYYLEALRYFGFALEIHSPLTSRTGLYVVHGSRGIGPDLEIVHGQGERLLKAILSAAVQMGGMRLETFRKLAEQAGADHA
ncbi:hypothetical protein [Nonomuraea typhae]|uniref:hypothetical protein n=1 Tax=Nonomuraea typhae TaxID=2603600 RepID=UPI0012FB8904|nr:hypothetical protein [Nonomuraea typhae]